MFQRKGKLAKMIASKRRINVPFSETVQSIEVSRHADGSIVESPELIAAEKEKRLAELKAKYGDMDETNITWIMVKKATAEEHMQHDVREHPEQQTEKQPFTARS